VSGRAGGSRAGFTLIEVLVALVVLTVGVLALAGATAVAVRQVVLADVTTERAAALQSVIEGLRARPYDSLTAGSDTVGTFSATWTVSSTKRSKVLSIVTLGPGLESAYGGMPRLAAQVRDTFVYRIARP